MRQIRQNGTMIMNIKALVLGTMTALAITGHAQATTFNFLPSNGAFADGIFTLRLDGLTAQTLVTYRATVTPNYSCTINPTQQPGACQDQGVSGNLSAPGEFGNPPTGFNDDNTSPRPGSQAGFRLTDIGNVFLDPTNSILNLTYDFVRGSSSIASIIFEVTFAAGEPFDLAGQLIKDNGQSEVPVPAALPLFLAGISALGVVSRRKRQKR
jgi:hypothetical protein